MTWEESAIYQKSSCSDFKGSFLCVTAMVSAFFLLVLKDYTLLSTYDLSLTFLTL